MNAVEPEPVLVLTYANVIADLQEQIAAPVKLIIGVQIASLVLLVIGVFVLTRELASAKDRTLLSLCAILVQTGFSARIAFNSQLCFA